MEEMGNEDVRSPSESGLTFDHVLSRLQRELQRNIIVGRVTVSPLLTAHGCSPSGEQRPNSKRLSRTKFSCVFQSTF
jgi:hypothetical protein